MTRFLSRHPSAEFETNPEGHMGVTFRADTPPSQPHFRRTSTASLPPTIPVIRGGQASESVPAPQPDEPNAPFPRSM